MFRPPSLIAWLLVATATALAGCPHGPGMTPQPPSDDVQLTREHLRTYNPGGTIRITVEIDTAADLHISALALVEQAPPGWVFIGAEHIIGIIPAIRPQQGDEGTLTFVWIQPPRFPYTFSYTLGIPLSASGPAMLTGRVEYRQGTGPAEFSETLVSTFQGP